jgi:hypothetical protein
VAKKWRIKTNETKSVHVIFTSRKKMCLPVILNGLRIPQAEDIKYLGLHLDRKLHWKKHIHQAKTTWSLTRKNLLATQ